MITLFPDQQDIIDATRLSMKRNKSVLICAETGSGKTVLTAAMIHAALLKGTRSIFVVPRRELLRQTAKTFDKYNIPYSYVSAGKPYNPYSKVFIATVQTLINWIKKGVAPEVELCFGDEVHYATDGMDIVFKHYAAKNAWRIGLTASPWRADGRGLGRWFTDMVRGPSLKWLIDNKRLSDYRLFQPSRPNLSGIKKIAGEYARGELDEKMRSERVLIGDAVRYYKEHAFGKLNIGYCTSIEHSEQVAEAFRNQGIAAASISGKTPDDELARRIQAFAKRELLVLTNCDLCTFGFDLSASSGIDVQIEAMTDLRPTESLSLQCQKVGRVLRYKDAPAFLFDHAGNSINEDGTEKHGLPCRDIDWTLTDRVKKTKESSERAIGVKQCTQCYYCYTPAPQCPNCGHVPAVQGREVEHIDGQLHEIDRKNFVPKVYDEKTEKKQLFALMLVFKKRGYSDARAKQTAQGIIDKQKAKRSAK